MRDDHRLKRVAGEIREELKRKLEGQPIRMRRSTELWDADSGGWCLPVASLAGGKVSLEIWLDRYPGPGARTFSAWFFSSEASAIRELVMAAKPLWPVHTVLGMKDVVDGEFASMRVPLKAGQYNKPSAEYYGEENFFGFYDRMTGPAGLVENRFTRQAVAFFLDVAGQMVPAASDRQDEETYPRHERAVVRQHLRRERSRYLAAQCKERDEFRCQVCGMSFEERYGPLGRGFAEAHHKSPLAKLNPKEPTRLEDLATVCANCHRMLHRMEGNIGDLERLRKLIRPSRS